MDAQTIMALCALLLLVIEMNRRSDESTDQHWEKKNPADLPRNAGLILQPMPPGVPGHLSHYSARARQREPCFWEIPGGFD